MMVIVSSIVPLISVNLINSYVDMICHLLNCVGLAYQSDARMHIFHFGRNEATQLEEIFLRFTHGFVIRFRAFHLNIE